MTDHEEPPSDPFCERGECAACVRAKESSAYWEGRFAKLETERASCCVQMEEERDAARKELADTTRAFDQIAAACGSLQWEYPGQVVRDVEEAVRHRDRLADLVILYESARRRQPQAKNATVCSDRNHVGINHLLDARWKPGDSTDGMGQDVALIAYRIDSIKARADALLRRCLNEWGEDPGSSAAALLADLRAYLGR